MRDKIVKILNDADMYGDYTEAVYKIEELCKQMYNQAINDAIKYGQVRCTTTEISVTASIYGTVKGESFKVDEETLKKLKKT